MGETVVIRVRRRLRRGVDTVMLRLAREEKLARFVFRLIAGY